MEKKLVFFCMHFKKIHEWFYFDLNYLLKGFYLKNLIIKQIVTFFFHIFLALLFLALYLTRFLPRLRRKNLYARIKKNISIAYNFCGKENIPCMLIIGICRALIA